MKLKLLKKIETKQLLNIISENYSANFKEVAKRDVGAMFSGRWAKPTYIVATEKNKVVGFGGFGESWMDTNVCEIFWVNVQKKYQAHGAGTSIMKEILRRIKKTKFSFIILSTTVPKFYYQFGFKKLLILPKSKYTLMGLDTNKII